MAEMLSARISGTSGGHQREAKRRSRRRGHEARHACDHGGGPFQGYRICTSPDGRTSAEWEWQGMRLGQNSDGDRWTTTPWRDNTITTVTPAPEPR